jgi:hypothetical protein
MIEVWEYNAAFFWLPRGIMRMFNAKAVLASLMYSALPALAVVPVKDAAKSPEMEICSSDSAAGRTRPYVSEAKAVYFVNLRDGDKVTSPFRIAFGLVGMGIAPAGVPVENTGHHHLLINQKLSNDMLVKSIPFTDRYRHFGRGETEATLELPVGRHTLRLLFADANHKPYYLSSKEITIEVIGKNGLSK